MTGIDETPDNIIPFTPRDTSWSLYRVALSIERPSAWMLSERDLEGYEFKLNMWLFAESTRAAAHRARGIAELMLFSLDYPEADSVPLNAQQPERPEFARYEQAAKEFGLAIQLCAGRMRPEAS